MYLMDMAVFMKLFPIIFLTVFNVYTVHCHFDFIEPPNGIPVNIKVQPQHHLSERRDKNPFLDCHDLQPGDIIAVPPHQNTNHLEVFCYSGRPKTLQTFFQTVHVQLAINSTAYRYYEGLNSSEVHHLQADTSWFSFSPWTPSSFRMDLYNQSCVGIETSVEYRVYLRLRYVDMWRVVCLCAGVLVFVTAPRLARNLLFHYLSATTIGVLGSFLIIVLLLARYIPKRAGALSVLVGGSGLFLYMLQLLHSNLLHLVHQYQNVFLGYVSVTAVLSFAVVYRWGGLTDPRSVQLLQWLLQGCGLAALYCSSQHREATLALVLLLLVHHNTPPLLTNRVKAAWHRRFPPKMQYLTEEEYIQQGNVSTAEALDELRRYCRSPECNAWRTMGRLQTPKRIGSSKQDSSINRCSPRNSQLGKRFAEFVEGSSHLLDDEILQYEHAHYSSRSRASLHSQQDLTDDEEAFSDDED